MTNVRYQIEALIVLDDIVEKNHPYRDYDRMVDFRILAKPMHARYSDLGRREIGAERGLRMLILQFVEDLSDREMERFIRENMAARRFCGFAVNESTPDHSYFGAFRKRLGTEGLMNIFDVLRTAMKEAGLIREIFTFVDASKLESKLNVWGERDRVIAAGHAEFTNETPQEATLDVDARQGSKGPGKNFHGYKRHDAVDMQSGLVNRVAATSGEVTDAAGLAYVCPSGGAVYADKGYCGRDAIDTLDANGCHDATIKRDNMKIKNRDKDRWISRMRSPYERVFSKTPNRMRYLGLDKAQFQVGAFAIAHNLKRLVVLGVEPIPIA